LGRFRTCLFQKGVNFPTVLVRRFAFRRFTRVIAEGGFTNQYPVKLLDILALLVRHFT
jgi:hypothetical protein